jgi:3-carboxy-cis,cis-muconate cycloisomerase
VAGLELIFADEACARALADDELLAAMARFEAALARAAAKAALITGADAEAIAAACAEFRPDAGALALAARKTGALAIPFVDELRKHTRTRSASAAEVLHSGATSQDVMDTGMVLCLRPACERIAALAVRLGDAAAGIAQRHRATPSAGRTLLQPALPLPFGYKAAIWLAPLARALPAFKRAVDGACVLQFGGPAGTLSSFGDRSTAVEAALAAELGLALPAAPWHSARDGIARLGAEAAILAGSAGKIARDVSLLMQPEVGEASEAAPGGSSSMAHKRNPSHSLLALEAALRTPGMVATLMAQLTPEHERGLGQWQSQWFTLRELLCATGSALAAMSEVLETLEVDAQAMRANMERSAIPPAEHGRGFGTAQAMIDRVLEAWRATSRGTWL